jgi:hypothetical protein
VPRRRSRIECDPYVVEKNTPGWTRTSDPGIRNPKVVCLNAQFFQCPGKIATQGNSFSRRITRIKEAGGDGAKGTYVLGGRTQLPLG